MLYLLDKEVKTVKWNGIPLHEASSAIVKEEINGDFTLTIRYPITDTGIYQLIKEDMLIKAPSPVLGPQLFRIKKPVENDDSLDITAYHISDDVMQRSIRPVSVVGQGCAMALSQMVQNAKTDLGNFSFTSDIMDSRTFNTTDAETLYSVLLDGKHSIVGTWEGELVRDNFALTIKRSRGADRGVVITTHKNLKSYQRTKNSQSVVTRIHAKSTFKAEGAEEETTINVTVDSPLIGKYPYINEKDYENNNAKTVDELRKWAEAKFKNEGIDKISDAIEIEAYELDGQVIHLGDTVNIKSKKHDVDIYKKAIAYEFNALTEEYISITFDDKPGVGGSGVSSGLSNAADVILGVNANAQEIAVERAIKNANQAFDAEFEKQKIAIEDGIEQAKAEAELYADTIKQNIDAEIDAVNASMQAQSDEHDRQVADILSKTRSVETLANQAKSDAASAIARANQVKTEAIADARAQVATVSQALNTAKTELQTAIVSADQKARDSQASATALRNDLNLQAQTILAQAQAQTALTNRVTSVETLADGTRLTVAELSKTVNKATGDIASVTNRTKTVEDTLSQMRTQYDALTQTVNTQTGQIDSINRKTADLQSGIDGVTERFESLQVGNKNYLPTSRVVNRGCTNFRYNETSQSWSMTVPTGATTGFGYGITFNTSGLNILLNGGETLFFGLMIKANKACSFNYDINNALSGSTSNDNDDRSKQAWSPSNKSISANVWTRVWFSYTAKANVPITESNSNFGIVNNTEAVDIEIKEVIVAKSKVPVDYQSPDEDTAQQIAEYKRTADQNYSGLQSTVQTLDGKITQNKTEANQTATQLSNRLTSLETFKNAEGTRAQAYFEAAKTETAKQITAERTATANNYVGKSTYQEDAAGITRRLTATETVANTAKTNLATYQETNDRRVAALETFKTSANGTLTQLSNKVEQNAQQTRETISAVEAKIPTKVSGRNLAIGSSDQWNSFITISSNTNWGAKLATVLYGDSTGIYAGTTINIFVYLSADDIVLDSTINPHFFIQGAVIDKQNKVTWTDWDKYNPFYNKWSTNLVAGNNYRIVKISSKVTAESYANINGFELSVRIDGAKSGKFHWRALMITTGDIFPDYWEKPVEDLITEISNAKLDITKTAEGLKLAATKTELTNAQNSLQSGINTAKAVADSAQAKANSNASTITQHTTQITALNNELSAKVSKTDYNTLTGRMTSAETTIQAQAGEISKRLTSTQVESAITSKGYQTASQVNATVTSKGYQTKSDVDSNITGRGYITSSALQPYVTTTVLENKVKETSDSFNRTISSVRLEIPTNTSMRNLILKSSDKWGAYTSTNNANSNWCPEICRITLDSDRGISVGKKLNLFVYISADNVTLDSSSNHRMAIQATIIKKDGTNLWHADVPFHGQWSQNLKTGNNYYVIKLTKEIKATAYENGATLIVQCRIDGANHVDFHHRAAMITTGDMFPDTWYPAPEDLATVTALHDVKDTVSSHTRTIGAVGTAGSILDNVSKVTQTAAGLVQEVSGSNGLKTQVSTLAGSYAIKNLTNSGTVLNQLNLNKDGSVKIDGKLVQITGTTYIQDGVISAAKIGDLDAGKIKTGTLDAARIATNSITGSHILFNQAFFNSFMANEAYLKQVFAKNAFITSVQAVAISASNVTTGILRATNGAMDVNLDNASMVFRQDAKIEFQSENNTLFRTRNGTSAFIHFRDDGYNGVYTAMGVNADNTGTQNDYSSGRFAGVRVIRTNPNRYSGTTIDQVQLIGDEIRMRHGYGYENDYLIVNYDGGPKINLMAWLRQFNTNFMHLVNITGRGDVIKTF
ncbi:phage tail spike protein [Streptococcus suis]